MRRAVTSLRTFDFRSDFNASESQIAPQAKSADVTLSASEFAGLLEEARSAGAAQAVSAAASAQEARLQDLAEALARSLKDLAELAGLLEDSALDKTAKIRSRALIRQAAQSIIDGQGDLFADHKESHGGVTHPPTKDAP